MAVNRGDVASSGSAAAAGVEPAQEGGQRPGAGTLPAAPSAPDGQAGTRNLALTINTSYVEFTVGHRQTPLGRRSVIHGVTFGGGRRELASVKSDEIATRVVEHLNRALSELNAAAQEVVRDREGS